MRQTGDVKGTEEMRVTTEGKGSKRSKGSKGSKASKEDGSGRARAKEERKARKRAKKAARRAVAAREKAAKKAGKGRGETKQKEPKAKGGKHGKGGRAASKRQDAGAAEGGDGGHGKRGKGKSEKTRRLGAEPEGVETGAEDPGRGGAGGKAEAEVSHRIELLLHTIRAMAKQEEALCSLAHEIARSGRMNAAAGAELRAILEELPVEACAEDVRAIRVSMGAAKEAVVPAGKPHRVKRGRGAEKARKGLAELSANGKKTATEVRKGRRR